MGTKMGKRLVFFGMLTACCAAFLINGCSEKSGGTREPNMLPDTHISYGPAEDSLTFYRIQVFWFGSDVDGDVDHFEVATVKNLRSGDVVDSEFLDNLDWGYTASKESTFVVEADSCCYGEPEDNDPHYATSFWGILIRSVDDQGESDDSPASVFLQASNLIPRARIRVPEYSPGLQSVPPRPYVLWEGTDADGDETRLQYKYLLIPVAMKNELWDGQVPPLSYEGSGGPHQSPDVGMWSEWVEADCTYVRDIDLSPYKIGSAGQDSIYLYITSKDEGGAFLPPELFYSYNEGNNVQRLQVLQTGAGVKIVIEGEAMGVMEDFSCRGRPEVPPAIFAGTAISLRFWGRENIDQGKITESYRYYLDEFNDPASRWNFWTSVEPLRDPANSPQWRVRFPTEGRFVPAIGSHVFGVELRDFNRDTTCAEFHFDVLPGPQGRETNVLLVDDYANRGFEGIYISDFEEQEFEMWSSILEGYDWQEWDTGFNFKEETPVRLVGGATTVIWSVDLGSELAPDLFDLCSDRGNYLQSYVNVGGNLIIIGHSPIYCTMYWPDGTPDPGLRQNVTDIDFSPRVVGADTTYNFMWDIFGVKRMQLSGYPVYYVDGLLPCEPYTDWNFVPVAERGTHHRNWRGYIPGPFLMTEFREGADVHTFYGVHRIEQPWGPPDDWEYIEDCTNMGGVYVSGNANRGWAAYINLPAFWMDHEELEITIRRLLEMFGELPQE
jgi:hypothetical protein